MQAIYIHALKFKYKIFIQHFQEEIYPPELSELVRLCCNSYNREQVRQLELLVLKRLQWCLLAPTANFFLEYHAAERIHQAVLAGCTVKEVRLVQTY